MRTELSPDELREVLARAEEIHSRNVETGDAESILRAAEEAGLPREAIEKALEERFGAPREPAKPGELIFAQSTDGKHYVAEALSGDHRETRVRFLKGGEHSVPTANTRPASFLPGERVVCPWPFWGWWTCTVISYDAPKKKIKVTDGWGEYQTFSIKDVHIIPPRPAKARPPMGRLKALIWTYALGAVSGGAIGAWITWLLTR